MKKLGSLGALVLLCLFMCSAALVVVFEAIVYENVMHSNVEQAGKRSAIRYLAKRLRNFDIKESIEVRNIQGTDVLVFIEQQEEKIYETWLYAYKGSLCEIEHKETGEIEFSKGNVITQIQQLNIRVVTPELIKFKVQDESGREYIYTLFIRSRLKAVQNET